ncbi:glutamate--tRNA ligase family protein [Bifidobacterium scaligerum]|uniref:glutamate--tRNA ligase family protein n=1 Tax=Bifidobacterium scaligerum TaxID=2052656 RepID=UPI003F6E3502
MLYPCFCSRADLRAASAPNEGDGFMVYPGACRRLLRNHPDEVRARLARGDRHSIRIAMPESGELPNERVAFDQDTAETQAARIADEQAGSPLDEGIAGTVAYFNDRIYGPQRYDLPREVGDSVIRRADGLFGYQLVVVVDDLDMGVDDIVRGRDLLRSTALQMWIRRCLLAGGFQPEYGGAATAPPDPMPSTGVQTVSSLSKESRANQVGPFAASRDLRQCPNIAAHTYVHANMNTSASANTAANANASGAAAHRQSPAHPAYAHLPLIDNAAGRRLAKRERSLDMGALRARGVSSEQIIGYCAWLLRLRPTPEPCRAADLTADFSWESLAANHSDRMLDPSDPLTPQWLAEAL